MKVEARSLLRSCPGGRVESRAVDDDFFCDLEEEILRFDDEGNLVYVRLKEEVQRVSEVGDFLVLRTAGGALPYKIAGIRYGDRKVVTLRKVNGMFDFQGQQAIYSQRMLEESEP